MKMTTQHYATIETAIGEVLTTHNSKGELVHAYQSGKFHNADKCKDLQKRFCFDLLYGTGLNSWVCSNLYPYLDDTHIYTVLKSICPVVTKQF